MGSHIRRDRPGGGPGGLEWTHPGHVVEVDDPTVATQLLRIPGGGFSEVIPENGGGFSEIDDPGFVVNPEPPRRKRGRPRKNVTPDTPVTEAPVPHAQIDSQVGHDVSGAPHAGERLEWVADDEVGQTWSGQPGESGRQPGMVAPNAEAVEANGARAAGWHARAVDPNS